MDDLALLVERALAAQPTGVVSAYLFGSHVEGRAHRESDVDVGILLERQAFPTSRDRFDARLVLEGAIGRSVGTSRIDVVILNDAPPHLGRRIVTEGRRVFCADPGADLAYIRDVQLLAADLEPFLRRMRRLKLGALARS